MIGSLFNKFRRKRQAEVQAERLIVCEYFEIEDDVTASSLTFKTGHVFRFRPPLRLFAGDIFAFGYNADQKQWELWKRVGNTVENVNERTQGLH